jgi:hypothetical protein
MEVAGSLVENAQSGRGTEHAVNDRFGHERTRRGAARTGSPRQVRRAATDNLSCVPEALLECETTGDCSVSCKYPKNRSQ